MARLDPLLALLLLLPAAWLAWPATLAGQLEPELSATGWWVLLSLAPALLLLVRPSRSKLPAATCYGGFLALSLLALQLSPPSDSLSAARSLLAGISGLVAIHAGSALGQRGRRTLALGMVLVSLALSLPALAGVSARTQGALLNSGATSEAALLGGLCAAVASVFASGAWRILAWLSVAAFGAFVALAPALSGALVFSLSLGFVAWRARANRRALALPLAVFGLCAITAWGVARSVDSPPPTALPASQPSGGDLGGVGVRLSLAPGALALFAEHPWLGSGAGQFRSAFPRHRDPLERERSNRAAGSGVETEVEHAHNDYLTTLAEAGALGFLAWLAALLLFAVGAWPALAQRDPVNHALAACVLGGLLNAGLRCPLSFNPASASLFFAAAGALLAREGETQPVARSQRLLPVLLVALLWLQAPQALAFVRHGRALRVPDAIDTAAALAACPDSPLALALAARQSAGDAVRARELWERVLVLRPLNFEARVQAGVLAARADDAERAREHWRIARELAPEQSRVHQNLLSLEAEFGDDAAFQRAFERASGLVPRSWLEQAGANALLEGDEAAALRLWKAAGAAWIEESPEQLYERARTAVGERTPLVHSLECWAHWRWAREHARLNNFSAAVRSYRQALRLAPQARALHLELAAALLRNDQGSEARAEVERTGARARDWTRLPAWAGEALVEAGLLAR